MSLTRSQAGAAITIKKHGKGSNAFYTVLQTVTVIPEKQFRSTYAKALAYRNRLIDKYSQTA